VTTHTRKKPPWTAVSCDSHEIDMRTKSTRQWHCPNVAVMTEDFSVVARRTCMCNEYTKVCIACSLVELEKDAIWEPGHVQVNCSVTYVRHLGAAVTSCNCKGPPIPKPTDSQIIDCFFFLSFFLYLRYMLPHVLSYMREPAVSAAVCFSPLQGSLKGSQHSTPTSQDPS
jgi:hypothetical protein